MALTSESIKLLLHDGTFEGTIKCSFGLMSAGIAYRIPKNEIKKYKDIPELQHLGVYILFGKINSDDALYIGLTDQRPLIIRISESINKHPWCTEVIFFTSSNKYSFEPTHTHYLESSLINFVHGINSDLLKNSQIPDPPFTKINDMEKFLDYIKLIVKLLGYTYFESLSTKKRDLSFVASQSIVRLNNPELFISQDNVKAKGKRTSGFVVFTGSDVKKTGQTHPFTDTDRRNNYLSQIDSNGKLTEDVYFKSVKAATEFILDNKSNINGNIIWKTADGILLKDLD